MSPEYLDHNVICLACLPCLHLQIWLHACSPTSLLAMVVAALAYRMTCMVISICLCPASFIGLYIRHAQRSCSASDPQTWIGIIQILNDSALVTVGCMQGRGSRCINRDLSAGAKIPSFSITPVLAAEASHLI